MIPASTPLRVVFVITGLAPGGAERCLVQVALGLAAWGKEHANASITFEPIVVSLQPRPQGEQAMLVERLKGAGIPVHFLDAGGVWDAPSVLSRLTQLLAEVQPHVVQTFLFHANVLGATAAWRAGVGPVIAGVRVAEPSWWRPSTEAFCRPLIARWVCVSERVAEFVRTTIGVSPDLVEVIPNGIDLGLYPAARPLTPSDLGLPPGRRVLGFVGRLEPQKGLDWLLSFLPDILALLPEHDLVVVGAGSQESALIAQAKSTGLANRVHWLGWRRDLAAVLPACDVVLLPSRYEGMSNVLLEAMACGRPVVATDVEGVGEVLGLLAEQQLVPMDDSGAFADRIARLAGEPLLGHSLGRLNRERVAGHYTLGQMIGAYARLYQTMQNSASP